MAFNNISQFDSNMFNKLVETEEIEEQEEISEILPIEKQEIENKIEETPKIVEKTEFTIPKSPEPKVSDLERIKSIISVFKSYDNMPEENKIVVLQFLGLTADQDESLIIHKILRTPKTQSDAIVNLIRVKKLEPADRAFELMSMKDEDLMNLNMLVESVYSNQENTSLTNRITFCKNLQEWINNIQQQKLQDLFPVAELIEKGRI